MNPEIFSKFISSPGKISAQDIPALEAFAEQFPYCQLAHFFVAKPHYDLMTVHAEDKVQKAAVFATSRYKLKKFLEIAHDSFTQRETGSDVGPVELAETIPVLQQTPLSSPAASIADLLAQADLSAMPLTEQEKVADQPLSPDPPVADSDIHSSNEQLKKTKQQEIIDNFIKSEPRITSLSQVSKDIPSKDLSEGSSKVPAGLVSENLANIMLKQGKTDKAIEIYEKLLLKYPEKKSYFAEKIESLKSN